MSVYNTDNTRYCDVKEFVRGKLLFEVFGGNLVSYIAICIGGLYSINDILIEYHHSYFDIGKIWLNISHFGKQLLCVLFKVAFFSKDLGPVKGFMT